MSVCCCLSYLTQSILRENTKNLTVFVFGVLDSLTNRHMDIATIRLFGRFSKEKKKKNLYLGWVTMVYNNAG